MMAFTCVAAARAFRVCKWHRAVHVTKSGAVREPASGNFDVTVAPGEDVQAAIDHCPPGGCVLLLPGTHAGPLVLVVEKEVHVFGRGLATLQSATRSVVASAAAKATLDGLLIRREAGGINNLYRDGVWITGGRLRLQACDITSAASGILVFIEGGADPVLAACRCARGGAHVHVRAPYRGKGAGQFRPASSTLAQASSPQARL